MYDIEHEGCDGGDFLIGVFDSGLGGLTVLERLSARLPKTQFVYLGDQGHAPFGTQTAEQVYELTRQGVEELFLLDCQLVILACNTASTVALRRLQEEWLPSRWSQRRVLGIVVPTIEAITGRAWHSAQSSGGAVPKDRTIGILVTPATVASEYFLVELAKRDSCVRVVQEACPQLAGLIEGGADSSALKREVEASVESMVTKLDGSALDQVLLGCTHYALVEELFAKALPAGCGLLSQAQEAAAALQRYLDRHPQFRGPSPSEAPPTLLTTGDAVLVSELATRFLGRPVRFAEVRGSASVSAFRL